ncbi:hypothetical protein EYF80_031770 [Liparis tanakae]|uniref:Uncharacterized protein n=1 Tax=Liparis tanakae TaxID=230148 RepID=A0A4Z2GZE1_9TELE|nr:hypothetical protein EYF80_031770 [Liparis tanakae]
MAETESSGRIADTFLKTVLLLGDSVTDHRGELAPASTPASPRRPYATQGSRGRATDLVASHRPVHGVDVLEVVGPLHAVDVISHGELLAGTISAGHRGEVKIRTTDNQRGGLEEDWTKREQRPESIRFPKYLQPVGVSYSASFMALATLRPYTEKQSYIVSSSSMQLFSSNNKARIKLPHAMYQVSQKLGLRFHRENFPSVFLNPDSSPSSSWEL